MSRMWLVAPCLERLTRYDESVRRGIVVCPVLLALAVAGAGEKPDWSELPVWVQAQRLARTAPVDAGALTPETADGWAALIDSTWGEGLTTFEKLRFFEASLHTG